MYRPAAMEWGIIPKLKCAKCGGKRVGLIYTPDTSPNGLKARPGADEWPKIEPLEMDA
jgi:hypothetical protein